VRLRVEPEALEPALWRRLVLPIGWRPDQLQLGIRAARSRRDHRRNAFRSGRLHHGDVGRPDTDFGPGGRQLVDERQIRLGDVAGPGARFGDEWHQLVEIASCSPWQRRRSRARALPAPMPVCPRMSAA